MSEKTPKKVNRREFMGLLLGGVGAVSLSQLMMGCRKAETTVELNNGNPEATQVAQLTNEISALQTAVAEGNEQKSTFSALTIMCGDGNEIEIKKLSGDTCGVNAMCSWKVPEGASVDYNGLKLAPGEIVGPGGSTLHDCSLAENIIGYSPDNNEQREIISEKQEKEVDACNKENILDLPAVKGLMVQNANNGQAQVRFDEKGNFVVPKGWDLDFYGNKYGPGSIVEVKEKDFGTLWAPIECKPLEW